MLVLGPLRFVQRNAVEAEARARISHLRLPRVLWSRVWSRKGLWEAQAPQKAHSARIQAVHPQRGREDPGRERQVRGQDHAQLGALQGAHAQLQPRHHL